MAPQQIYEVELHKGDFSKCTEILSKFKIELRIVFFLELADYLKNIYTEITVQQDVPRKSLVFMESLFKFAIVVRKEINLSFRKIYICS